MWHNRRMLPRMFLWELLQIKPYLLSQDDLSLTTGGLTASGAFKGDRRELIICRTAHLWIHWTVRPQGTVLIKHDGRLGAIPTHRTFSSSQLKFEAKFRSRLKSKKHDDRWGTTVSVCAYFIYMTQRCWNVGWLVGQELKNCWAGVVPPSYLLLLWYLVCQMLCEDLWFTIRGAEVGRTLRWSRAGRLTLEQGLAWFKMATGTRQWYRLAIICTEIQLRLKSDVDADAQGLTRSNEVKLRSINQIIRRSEWKDEKGLSG